MDDARNNKIIKKTQKLKRKIILLHSHSCVNNIEIILEKLFQNNKQKF